MTRVNFGLLVLAVTWRVSKVLSHSWVECTDYDMSLSMDDNSYSTSDCSGWARSWSNYGSSYFGQDRGAHEDITYATKMCKDSIGSSTNHYSSTYTSTYPMAQYTVGETIRLLWPAKNHGNYECNAFQLDNAMKLFVNNNNVNPSSDLGRSTDEWTLVIDWHAESGETFVDIATDGDPNVISTIGVDGVPYQNCPRFCDDTDLAVCYGDFTLPDIFAQNGVYTFVWYWEFKSNQIFSHCFEANVTINTGNTQTTTDTNTDDSETDSGETTENNSTLIITNSTDLSHSTDSHSSDSSDSSDSKVQSKE